MQQSISAILSVTDIFDSFNDTQLELVAAICQADTYQTDDILLKENDQSTELYVIARGGVEVVMNPTFVSDDVDETEMVVLTELRQGQVFGEVALVDQGIRSATIRVSQANTLLLRIDRQRIMQLCDTYPELGYKLMKNLAADLAFKIRNTDLTIRQYQLMLSQSKLDAS
ncbi:cyclic nucleotide-binding domain-containing protein [Candidatus Leptofilum sp.]|uniref:cyclic nucleotide-binding domain-containing protein n=1 Tax=Candidatus Leptofilum sp. TaxID=3241576 RepID=UPI003B5C113B